ncbi:MAG: lysophospholipid acyltransferase family protein [Spirochaetaceae bacterium]
MRTKAYIVNTVVKTLFRLLYRLDAHQLQHVPGTGPALLLSNHVTNLEGPLLYVFLAPRKLTALGKIELWQNPFTRFFMETWKIIPLHRGSVDGTAMRTCFDRLSDDYIVGIAAEGTRSRDGVLKRGMPGATLLATRANCPVIPVAHWGLPDLVPNLRRMRRARATVRVGHPFYLKKADGSPVTRSDREQMLDEMMYQLASLLPPELRGAYADLSRMTTEFIVFTDSRSDLRPAQSS